MTFEGFNSLEGNKYTGEAIIRRLFDCDSEHVDLLDGALNRYDLTFDQVTANFADDISGLSEEKKKELVTLIRDFQLAQKTAAEQSAADLARLLSET